VSVRPHLLELALSRELLDALDTHIRELVAEAVRDERARTSRRDWLSADEAALQLGVSADAIRMRAKRGTIESMRQGRRVYVRLNGASRE
jgi:excisionase family DNA binding protein